MFKLSKSIFLERKINQNNLLNEIKCNWLQQNFQKNMIKIRPISGIG